jgi:putative ABC transport system permease protein
MIALVVLMLRARPYRAAAIILLTVLAVGTAVAVPVYLAAADRAAVRSELLTARSAEQVVTAWSPPLETGPDGIMESRPDADFEKSAVTSFQLAGFDPVFSASFDAGVEGGSPLWRLTYRDRVCEHITFVAGRCPAGVGEIALGQRSAVGGRFAVGDTLPMRQIRQTPDGPVQTGAAVPMSVVGVFRPTVPTEPYWGPFSSYPAMGVPDPTNEPVLTTRATMLRFALEVPEAQQVDLVPPAGTLTPDRLRALPAEVDRLAANALLARIPVTTEVDALAERAAANRRLAGVVVPMAAVPVVVLCWYVLFLAVGYASDERRTELGLVALRGSGRWQRWWLAGGESVLAVVIGAPIGYLTGHAIAWLAIRVGEGSGGVELGGGPLRWALAAAAGALVAVLLAVRRELATPTVDLLRRVAARAAWWRTALVEVAVLAAAAAVVIDQQTSGERAEGVLVALVPAALMLAGGLLVARTLGPVATRVGQRALRRGGLGAALAAIDIARRPASRRVLALLIVGTALVTFAATFADVGRRARGERVRVEAGAAVTVRIQSVSPTRLLRAVRSADPNEDFAMAAMSVPASDSRPAMLAVDTPRLGRTAVWPDRSGAVPPASVAERLRPPVPEPVRIEGDRIGFDVDVTRGPSDAARLRAEVLTVERGGVYTVIVNRLRAGRHRYEVSAPACRTGCRVTSVGLDRTATVAGRPSPDVEATIHEIRQLDPDRTAADATVLSAAGRWRDPNATSGSSALVPGGTDGLRLQLPAVSSSGIAEIVDSVEPLPVLASGSAARQPGQTLDGSTLEIARTAIVPLLPRLGADGTLADLEYLLLSAPSASQSARAEVWLAADAPTDALARLQAQGLRVESVLRLDDAVAAQERSGPALAIRFNLVAGALAVLLAVSGLGLVLGVDRRRRAADMAALRAQGLPASAARAAGSRGHLWLAGAALVTGPVLALIVWALVGDGVPLFPDDRWAVPAPRPGPGALVPPWLGIAGLLLVAAAVAGHAMRGASETYAEGGRR